MTYLKNVWYVAAWSTEVPAGKMLARRFLNEPVVLFREATGAVRALADRCPHRQAPLRLGTLEGDHIRCGYHGLAFDGHGQCVHNPHGPVPRAARVRTYPLVDRHGMLWIWMGDPARADPGLILDYSWQDPERFHVGKRYLNIKSSYQLEIENILDLSHIAFLHKTTLGSAGVSEGEFRSRQEGDVVWSMRSTENDTVPDSLADVMGVPRGALVDRWMDVRWDAPANMTLSGGGVAAGRPRSEGRGAMQAHCFTPETETSTHYWFGICFPKSMGEFGARLAEEQIDWLKVPFETEDRVMLEAQQQNILEGGDAASFRLSGDAAGVKALRVLERLIAEENGARAPG
jgi:phenylpropionate dioxygenase-like ring-hydroxylating dioxygenase large terminal subunit